MANEDNIFAFEAVLSGNDVSGEFGVALDTAGTSGFGGRGIATFAAVGDLDGDGADDLAAGSLWALSRDAVTVGNFSIFIGLDDADGSGVVRPTTLFRTPGTDNSLEGYTFSRLGDFDGDGHQEMLVGRDPRVNNDDGQAGGHIHHEFDQGVVIGKRISSAGGVETDFVGDLNGDGFDDIFVTQGGASPGHEILLGNLEGNFDLRVSVDGFAGVTAQSTGHAVAGGADVNGDGIDDLAVLSRASTSIIVHYGGDHLTDGGAVSLDPEDLGFTLDLPDQPLSVELLKDFNGDGIGDLLISYRGGAAVIFGGQDRTGTLSLDDIAPSDGLFIQINNLNHIALSAGDVNGDGLSDINFSDRQADGSSDVGVIFGHAALNGSISLDDLDGKNGFRITNATAGESIGDSNGNGFDDLLLRIGKGSASFMAIVHGHATPEVTLTPVAPPAQDPQDTVDFEGTERSETLEGSGSGDTVVGGDGNDMVLAGGGGDLVQGGGGADTLRGAYGDDTLRGGVDADVLIGGIGRDVADYSLSSAAVRIRLSTADGFGGDAEGDDLREIEDLVGSAHNDSLYGGLDDNALHGGLGDDRLLGLDGRDALFGGDGQDRLLGGRGNDTLNGDAGDDTLRGGVGRDLLFGGLGDDELDGGNSLDTLNGGAGNDKLYGRGGSDLLSGGTGDDLLFGEDGLDILNGGIGADTLSGGIGGDQLIGGSGNDVLNGDGGRDQLRGDEGQDILRGGSGNDTLHGGDGNDILGGMTGDDLLNGGNGNDTLNGGLGGDTLQGGAGADRFVVNGAAGDDLLLDFDASEGDRLDLTDFGADASDVLVSLSEGGSLVLTINDTVITLQGVQSINLDDSALF